VKALVQREDSLIKPHQSQNRISGFSTVIKESSPGPEPIYYLLNALESRVKLTGLFWKIFYSKFAISERFQMKKSVE
jgi:hypothetical protein